jgi:hypothetical protein
MIFGTDCQRDGFTSLGAQFDSQFVATSAENVVTFVATFVAKTLGKTVFVATLQPPRRIGIPRHSSWLSDFFES